MTKQDTDGAETVAMTVDPVITWLEQIRDFMGTTPQSKEMAQRTIDRLRPPTVDDWTIVGALVDDLGTLRAGAGAVISDRPHHYTASAEDAGYYGGYLVAESIGPRNATAFSFLPQLLVAARDTPFGQKILAQLAQALGTAPPPREPVRDRLDGCLRLARLAGEFEYAGRPLDVADPFYVVAIILKQTAAGLLSGNVSATFADLEAWLDRRREQRAAAAGASA